MTRALSLSLSPLFLLAHTHMEQKQRRDRDYTAQGDLREISNTRIEQRADERGKEREEKVVYVYAGKR